MNDNEMFDRLRRFGDTVDQSAVAAGAPAGPLRDVSAPRAEDEGAGLEPVVSVTGRRDRRYRAIVAAAAALIIVVGGAVITARIAGSPDGGLAASTDADGSSTTTTTQPNEMSSTAAAVVAPVTAAESTTTSTSSPSTSTTPTGPAMSPPHNPTCPDYRQNMTLPIRLCDSGAAVLIIQDHLGVNADGYFGPATRDAVRQFQSNHGIEVDGLVGPDTWRLLVPEAAGVDVDGDRIIEPTEMN